MQANLKPFGCRSTQELADHEARHICQIGMRVEHPRNVLASTQRDGHSGRVRSRQERGLRKLMLAAVIMIAVVILVVSIGVSSSRNCDKSASASLTVALTNSSGSAICDAEVTATDGSETFILEPVGCSYAGPWERAGTYLIRASHGGQMLISEPTRVSSGECHVKGKRLDLRFTR
jgi:hypothetical protein